MWFCSHFSLKIPVPGFNLKNEWDTRKTRVVPEFVTLNRVPAAKSPNRWELGSENQLERTFHPLNQTLPFAGRFSLVSVLSKLLQDISPSRSDSLNNKTKCWKPSGVCCRSREWKQWRTTWSRFSRPTSTTCGCSWTRCWATRAGWRESSSIPSTWSRTSRRSKSWANALLTWAGAAFLLSTSSHQLGNRGESGILEFPAMTFSQGEIFSVRE